MPLRIEATPVEKPRDALQLLLDGHERIRRFVALAGHVAEATHAPPRELSDAATQLVRYFTSSLPLHVEDEDLTLVPRLLDTGVPRGVVRRLWEQGRQHETLEVLVDALVPLWTELRDQPEHHARMAGLLVEGARRLDALMEEHLALEEEYLFPVARERLSRETLEQLALEFRERRHRIL